MEPIMTVVSERGSISVPVTNPKPVQSVNSDEDGFRNNHFPYDIQSYAWNDEANDKSSGNTD
jgi:hypothetical protein